jgi:hypothetical protein
MGWLPEFIRELRLLQPGRFYGLLLCFLVVLPIVFVMYL